MNILDYRSQNPEARIQNKGINQEIHSDFWLLTSELFIY